MRTRVLVVDDNAQFRDLFVSVLNADGLHACAVSTARAALERHALCRHRVALVDCRLEGAAELSADLHGRAVLVISVCHRGWKPATGVVPEVAFMALLHPFGRRELLAAVHSALACTP